MNNNKNMKLFKRSNAQYYMSIGDSTEFFSGLPKRVYFPQMDNAGEFFFILGRAKSLKLPIDEKLHEQLEKHRYYIYGEYNVIAIKTILYEYKVSGFNKGLKLMMEGKEWYEYNLKKGISTHPYGCHFLIEFSAFLYGLETDEFSIEYLDGIRKENYEKTIFNYAMQLWDYCYDYPENFKKEFLPKIKESFAYIESLEKDIEKINSMNRVKWNK